VRVPPSTPLAAIAKASHASTRDIVDLNPHLLRGMTPPRDSYLVRIPPGAAASFDSAFAALPDADRTATHRIETKKGDRAEGIARRHGISVSALEGFNPNLRRLRPSGKLVPGQVLVIPTPAVASASLAVPDPAIERFPNSTSRMKVHTVRRGETMGSIARRYGTTPARLMQINGLRKPVIYPGQTLLLSGSAARASKSTKAAKARAAVSRRASPDRASNAVSKKRSGTGSNAGARTKSKTAKGKARAN
jgi:LysM repeat protein